VALSAVAIDWPPVASPDMLRLRARILARIRAYFAETGALEVDTPVLSRAASTDPMLESFVTTCTRHGPMCGRQLYLHTSPEFPMKRLLAAGSGPIYQICKVFRDGEAGRFHNPEFTLLEWYRTGYDHHRLMDEVETLLRTALAGHIPVTDAMRVTYRELFLEYAGIDPFAATSAELESRIRVLGFDVPAGMPREITDPWLDLLMTHAIQPRLGPGLLFVHDYPASQAALARRSADDPTVAERFEAYLNGVELANGFNELRDARELEARLANDASQRRVHGRATVPRDECLINALRHGLPACSGVAMGVDRLLMLAGGAPDLASVIAFPFDRA
jgi:lysyl-tRNA synthetase class 2